MSEPREKSASLLRFLASGGMADEDPDVVRELLTRAHALAVSVLAEPEVSPGLRAEAQAFLDEINSDTNGSYDPSDD